MGKVNEHFQNIVKEDGVGKGTMHKPTLGRKLNVQSNSDCTTF